MLSQAERKVEREVARRLELIGADESQWPQVALCLLGSSTDSRYEQPEMAYQGVAEQIGI